MARQVNPGQGLCLVGLVLVVAGCGSPAGRIPSPGASTPVIANRPQSAPGGCGGTLVSTTAIPPAWARAGFGSGPAGIPWALGAPPDALAYLFATQLVAAGARPDHSSNKVLWVTRESPQGLTIRGHPLGRSRPVIAVTGSLTYGNQLPSIVDAPAAGCWSFDLSWGPAPGHTSTVNLEVLPAGTLPARPEP